MGNVLAARRTAIAVLVLFGAFLVAAVWPLTAAAAGPGGRSQIRHVFVIVLENESASTTFGPGSPAPYLSKTLTAEGAYLPRYYGIGHFSNDNYIAMVSGQAPNPQNQADCQKFNDFAPALIGSYGQVDGTGCVYPASVATIASQLTSAGFTWRDYNQSMGADPSREAALCAHPAIGATDTTQKATAGDMYATRHNPFVYFHSIIDHSSSCDSHVVGLTALGQDLASTTGLANYSFITPDLCNDGHDSPCANGQPGGLAQADQFLQTWVPRITGTAGFRQDGLLLVLFDEAATGDASSCCGEIPGPAGSIPGIFGPGGGDTGAVLLSPCIAPGTVTQTAYNHYSMLASVEDAFGLAHLGYAALPGETPFGANIYNRRCGPAAPKATVSAPPLLSAVSTRARIPLRWSATTAGGTGLSAYTVRVRDAAANRPRWRTLEGASTSTATAFSGSLGHTYIFAVTATNLAGQASPTATTQTIVPSGVRPSGGHYSRGWQVRRVSGAWQGRAIVAGAPGASFSLRFTGADIELIGERGPGAGVVQVTVDGHPYTVRLHAARRALRQVLASFVERSRRHHVTIRVIRGPVALEGYGISARRG